MFSYFSSSVMRDTLGLLVSVESEVPGSSTDLFWPDPPRACDLINEWNKQKAWHTYAYLQNIGGGGVLKRKKIIVT